MPGDSFSDAFNDDFECDPLAPAAKPTLKVLLYTDDPQLVQDVESEDIEFGVGKLKKFMALHQPAFANVCPELVSRNEVPPDDETGPPRTTRKLDLPFLNRYEQIWFFGIHQVNTKHPLLGLGGGTPESELDNAEVAALSEWMKSGGVLMAGDHANPDPTKELPPPRPGEPVDLFCPTGVMHETFLGLGRALGHRVPRAGELRVWQGPPTRCQEDNFNTQELSCGTDYDAEGLQRDSTPQNIVLVNFGEDGKPNPKGVPHCIFIDRRGCRIKVFPDHMHEGRITLPRDPDREAWPERGRVRPLPRIAAYGIDKRNGEKCPLVAVYDGDAVGRGRIVADSTWHHYFNVNLIGFDREGDPVREQLGQFYVNLALWLSRLETRRKMACHMFRWLATHPVMLEEVGAGILNVGRTALQILLRAASPCEIHELLLAATPPELRPAGETYNFPKESPALDPLPPKDLILGGVVQEYHRASFAAASAGFSSAGARRTLAEALRVGYYRAFEAHASLLSASSSAAQARLKLLSQISAANNAPAADSKE